MCVCVCATSSGDGAPYGSSCSLSHVCQPHLEGEEVFQNGWPAELLNTKELHPFDHRRHELNVEDSPKGGIDQLHEVHPGIAKMKVLAQQFVWWSNLDGDLEERVAQALPAQNFNS